MTGLPPTFAELEEFAADPDESAWERRVDRLLASPLFGEKWARHWLDVVRFAETLERVCIETVESGKMTKDLAILVGPDQAWMTTEQFFEAIVVNLEKEMADWA